MMSLGIGLCINQTRAVVEALFGARRRASSCARPSTASCAASRAGRRRSTAPPRRSSRSSRSLFALYFAAARCSPMHAGHYISLPFLLLFLLGFGYVGVLSLHQSR